MLLTPKSELENRIIKFQGSLQANGVEGALLVQNVDLFYFSGTAQNAFLYIPAEGKPALVVKKSFARAKEESKLDIIVPLPSVKKLPEVFAELGYPVPKTLGLELDVLPANLFLFYQEIFSSTKLIDVSGLIRQVRMVKSPYELDLLRASGLKTSQVFSEVPNIIRQGEGSPEFELAASIEGRGRGLGHMGHFDTRAFSPAPFFGTIVSGRSGAVPSAFDGPVAGSGMCPVFPIGSGTKLIGREEPLLVDFGGAWNGYIIDQSRTYAIGGLPENLIRAYETSLAIHNAVIQKIKPGADGSELFQLSLDMAAEAGLADHYMGYGADQAKFVAHGVGLELDELPIFANGLPLMFEIGMVFAIEPKFVFPEVGVVGIENTFAVTENGPEKLTSTPDDLIII